MDPNFLILTFVFVTATLLACLKGLSLLTISRRRKIPVATQDYLKGRIELGPADLCFPVRYASSEYFRNIITFLPWEAEGVLVLNDSHFLYFGRSAQGKEAKDKEMPVSFERNDCLVEYVEPKKFRDGGLSWFSLESADGQKHYFCTQGKIPNLTTEFGTTALYEKMTEQFSNF